MKINKKRCFLLLMLIMISILALGASYATEDTNQTTETIENNQEVSTLDTQVNINENTIKVNNKTTKSASNTYVSSDGNTNNDGSSKNSTTTLSNAIQTATSGQTILLTTNKTQDTYKFTSPISIYNKNINIVGESGKIIILDGQQTSAIFNIKSSTITLTNIQVINSKSTQAAITATNSDLTITNSVFKNNNGTISGSVLSRESNITITDSIFTNNTSENLGGAVTQLANKTLTITNTNFTNNSAKYDGGSVYSIQSNVNVTLSTFINNTARNGGALYIANNVNNIKLQVKSSTFTNNKATLKGDSIWTNYDITINHNAFISDNNNNWVYVDKNCNNNLNLNWWSCNTPDFYVITDNFIPDTWRLMKVTNQTNTNLKIIVLTVSINSLSDSTTTSVLLPERQVTYSASSGSFDTKTQTITSSVVNNYYGTNSDITIKIDKQQTTINTKLETYLYVNNITTTTGKTVKFKIVANPSINEKVTLNVNNLTITSTLTKGKCEYSYKIPTTWNANNYTIALTYSGNDIYSSKTVTGYLNVKDSNYVIMPLTNNDITLKNFTLPNTYDLRNFSLVTPVKSQGSSGSCWAFSSLGSLESVLLKNTGVSYDLSENNLKNVMKKYSIIGDSNSDPNTGFNDYEPIGYLVGWYGPINESYDVYSPTSYVSPIIESNIHVQDVYIIPNRKNSTDNDLIKQAVYLFGGVSTGLYKPLSKNSYTTGKDIDHSVVIVGWDDNYSRTNFSPNAPGDGAFIIKNSWGTSGGDSGYYYISYYDESIGSVGITDLTNEQLNYVVLLENNDNYTGIYQYDIAVNTLDESSLTDYIAFKNIYNMTKDENIAAFGSYFQQESDYKIEFYTNNNLIYSQSGHVTLPGYRTIRLDKFIEVACDEELTVIIKINGSEEKAVVLEYSDLYYSSINPNTSFLSFDGSEWMDLYEYECTAPIKLYTKDTPTLTSTAVESDSIMTVTTKIENTKSTGYLTYYFDDEIIKVNSKVINKTVTKDQTVTVSFNDTTKLKNPTVTVVYTSENYVIKQNISTTNNIITTTNITLNKIGTSYYKNNVTISGTLKDVKANKLINTTVIISINNINYTQRTNANGEYSLTYKTSIIGQNNVTVIYNGNSLYAKSNATTTFKVLALDTKLTLTTTSTVVYGDKVTITGKYATTSGVLLANMPVVVSVNGVKTTVNTNSSGVYTLTVKASVVGVNNVSVSCAGNTYYKSASTTGKFNVTKKNTKITVNSITSTNIQYKDVVKITGTLKDSDNKVLTNTNVVIYVNSNKCTAKTNSSGVYLLSYTTNSIGTNTVKVQYDGNSNYYQSNASTSFKVQTKDTKLSLNSISNVVYGDKVTITGKYATTSGVLLANMPVIVSVNGVKTTVNTNSSGVYTLTVKASVVGVNNVSVSCAGNTYYKSASTTGKFTVTKMNTKITLNSISSIEELKNVTISGKLETAKGVVLKNTNIILTVNNVNYTLKTDNNGVFNYIYKTQTVGTNNVSVSFAGNNYYNSTSSIKTFTVTKIVKLATIITVNQVYGVVGENITFVASVKDIKGNAVTGGNLVFKLNSKSLRTDGSLEGSSAVKKISVSNGVAKFTVTASLAIRGAKTISASYSGSTYYLANSTKKITTAEITLRYASLTVTASPSTQKQYETIKFTVKVSDVTKNSKKTTPDNNNNSYVYFKINGKTLTDSKNNPVKVKVSNGVATYNYVVPAGMSAIAKDKSIRYYNVTVGYVNPDYYPNTKNYTKFNVKKSEVNITTSSVIANMKTRVLQIKGNIKDYKGYNVIGTSRVNLKINGKTVSINNQAFVNVVDGKISMNVKIPDNIASIKSITLVTGARTAYEGCRTTITSFTKV